MTIEEVLKEVIKKLEKQDIEYTITGSIASNLYGVQRTMFADLMKIFNILNRLKEFKWYVLIEISLTKSTYKVIIN